MPWRYRVPFLIRLRDCRSGRLPTPGDFPGLVVEDYRHGRETWSEWARSVLEEGLGLVMLDGIDEVGPVDRDSLHEEVASLLERFPGNVYLISTRPEAVPPGWLAGLGFQEARIDPMSRTDTAQFIRNWHAAVAIEAARLGLTPDEPGLAEDLIAKLRQRPEIARLATTPLLCAMTCALHRENQTVLPEGQTGLYETLCRMLLERDRDKGLDQDQIAEVYRPIVYDDKKRIVRDLAYDMVIQGEISLARDEVDARVSESVAALPVLRVEDAPAIARALIERTGMLREPNPGRIDFIHNTFKEFLAAEKFVALDEAGWLVDHALDPVGKNVLLFAAATNYRENFATRLIHGLLDVRPIGDDEATTGQDDRRARQLIALRCRSMSRRRHPEWDAQLDQIRDGLFPPRSMADAEALATLGDDVTPFLEEFPNNAELAAACVRALRLIGTEAALHQLGRHKDDQREEVVAELSRAFNPCTLPYCRKLLEAGQRLPVSIASQVVDLSPLSGLSSLTTLDLFGTGVIDLSPLSGLTSLTTLDLSDTGVVDLSPLSGLTSLAALDLSDTGVVDLSPLSGLSSLTALYLMRTGVVDLSPLSGLSSLTTLILSGTGVVDLSPLSGLSSLTDLGLFGMGVVDLSPLSRLKNVRIIRS